MTAQRVSRYLGLVMMTTFTAQAWSAPDILADLFGQLDSNHDHKLSRQEAKQLPAVEHMFEQLDLNKDKSLSMQEFIALQRLAMN